MFTFWGAFWHCSRKQLLDTTSYTVDGVPVVGGSFVIGLLRRFLCEMKMCFNLIAEQVAKLNR